MRQAKCTNKKCGCEQKVIRELEENANKTSGEQVIELKWINYKNMKLQTLVWHVSMS